MSNITVYVICEGDTEEAFVKYVLAPYMAEKGIQLYAPRIGKNGHKGGNVSFVRAKNTIMTLLEQRSNAYVTTLFDYYGIGAGWTGQALIQANHTTAKKAGIMEDAAFDDICRVCEQAKRRFIPYIVMHEFEGLLFADTECLACEMNTDKAALDAIRASFDTPEDINNSPETAPSKRLLQLDPSYKKVLSGKVVAEAIGIDGIREKCPLFNSWLAKLEKLPSL